MQHKEYGIYEKFFKRILDIFCSLLALICLFWLYLLVALLVRIKLGKPVLFFQERPGRIDPRTGQEKIFRIYKFRTMTDARDEHGQLLEDDLRYTPFGNFIRKTSLDELPQLLCILKGDMSIVGPRPLRIKYLSRYSPEQRRRHEVRPGLSGLAEVNGRNGITWQEKFAYDVQYVDKITFWGDVCIICRTVYNVLANIFGGRQDIDVATEFMGNK